MMMKKPLVSIITPCFNSHSTIIETIRSVKNQSYQNIEHIVIDDGSTEPIKNVIQTYLSNIIFGGVSKSMLKKSRLDFDKIEKCE